MPKNILVTAQYDVEERYGSTSQDDYKKITFKCCESFNRHLIGLDEIIILKDRVNSYHEMFQNIYDQIQVLYFREKPCNILWTDSDNICLKPLNIFDQFDKFSMFLIANEYQLAFADPRCIERAKPLFPWMLANIRYYPAGMSDRVWDAGDNLDLDWIYDWAYECIIYNAMFHSQGITDFNYYHRPSWNVQGEGDLNSITPELVKDTVVLHCHATRNSGLVLDKMNKALELV